MLDKKQIWAIFSLRFKTGCRAAETAHKTSNTLGPGTASARAAQEVLRRRGESWWGARWPAGGSWRWPAESRLQREVEVGHSVVEEVKKQSGCLVSRPKAKTSSLWSIVFSYSAKQQKPFLDQIVMRNKMWILWRQVATSSVVGQRRSSKVLPKARLAPKKVMAPVRWSAAHLIPDSFLNPRETVTSEKCAQ